MTSIGHHPISKYKHTLLMHLWGEFLAKLGVKVWVKSERVENFDYRYVPRYDMRAFLWHLKVKRIIYKNLIAWKWKAGICACLKDKLVGNFKKYKK